MLPSHHSRARLFAALAASSALGATTAALAQDGGGSGVSKARAASATATAFARDDGDGRSGYVKVSGGGSERGAGTAVSASTSGGRGRAAASARGRRISLFGGLVTASSVSVAARASGSGSSESGRVKGLTVNGRRQGTVSSRTTYGLGGFGRLVAVDDSGSGIVGLRAKLTRDYEGHEAGSTAIVAFADADARDAVAEPKPDPAPEPKPDPDPEPEPKPDPEPDEPAAEDRKPPKAKRRKAPRTRTLATSKGFAFPVAGKYRYSNDWGAPRQHTGQHEGNDIFASAGTPAVAVCDGTLHRVGTNVVPGNRLWVKCDKGGDAFFYAHLAAFASDARSGAEVKAGQVVGFVGSTGDAEQTPPHVHFEVHPGGWGNDAVNPYPFLRAWENRRDVPAAAWAQRSGASAGQQPGTLVVVRDFLDN